ncbi:phosphatidylinositol N-acetylglucosaminyltransferase subunit C [Syncephalis pseudoplumigaleata]|uniref:Phosphatidylinositol N-acetylglucosaminyltransferase subunit C n=1 Tax=Syncephalis pseudoplumigaleata TaxID=1712513 RepID=A0A4P9Z306_9FUNG|nr:phosphatidylinositol N-acetylglucosaminyltransferase subunit C [Syncephalis pseudoplumigaleata]|eukprot:RKP26923.1 phosphatidylinositol N-acetylglucosaminyltransferase subunit C [Syncephalis pseudoplumigaleata]
MARPSDLPASTTPTSEQSWSSERVLFRKVLYMKQPYPDNYVDVTFLEHLQRNANLRVRDYWTTVQDFGVILQHATSVLIFVALFILLYTKRLSSTLLIWVGALLTIAGYIFWDMSIRRIDAQYQVHRTAFFIFATLLGLSPILRILTKDISVDTIWAMTVCMFLANMLMHDYGPAPSNMACRFSGAMSTNTAIFASVLLASRLDSNIDVFALTSIAVEWFALFPILRRQFKRLSRRHSNTLTCILMLICTVMYYYISWMLMLIYVAACLFITFVCTWWLISIQKYKNEIHGPWDEARPQLQRQATAAD